MDSWLRHNQVVRKLSRESKCLSIITYRLKQSLLFGVNIMRNISKLSLLAITSFLFTASAYADDFSDACARSLAPNSVEIDALPVTIAPEIQYESARALANKVHAGDTAFSNQLDVLALAHAQKSSTFEYKLNYLTDKVTGRVCYRVNAVAKIGYEPLKIVVASESNGYACTQAALIKRARGQAQVYEAFLPTVLS